MLNKLKIALVGLMLAPFSAFASSPPTLDVSEGLSSLTAAETALATVGGAIVALAGIALAWRWIKASFF